MIQNFLMTLMFVFWGLFAQAKVEVLFHPQGRTLEKISEAVSALPRTIDIAMYNLETTERSPIIKALMHPQAQEALENGEMQIRLIFEGYGTPEENTLKMQQLEDLGIDVRFLGSSRKVHHKFAVIKKQDGKSQVITGSANWSMGSQKNYHENIMFLDQEEVIAVSYQEEFDKLWRHSQEFGSSRPHEIQPDQSPHVSDTMGNIVSKAHFNSTNFLFSDRGIVVDKSKEGFALTRALVKAIDQAKATIDIATTRMKLRPIYDALERASARGVKIRTVVSMDEFSRNHAKVELKPCRDPYLLSCSAGESFSLLLAKGDFAGAENFSLRVKFYNLDLSNNLEFQMHNKYIIVDGRKVLSGSFNWSVSSEYSHIENILELNGSKHLAAIESFISDFERLWGFGRQFYSQVLKQVAGDKSPNCAIQPMVLELREIDQLLKVSAGKTCQ